MSSMTYQDVDLAEVADLSAEDVEAREVFAENTVETVNNPLLNFLMEGGDLSGLSVGGRQRSARLQSGEEDPVVLDGSLYGQNFQEIRASCLEAGELWTDPEFPPDDGSLFFSERQVRLVHSHWSSSYITALSLVESFPSDACASTLMP